MTQQVQAGVLLREWRQRRRLSQLDLAIAANVSSRHLSFIETGRARPTSEMILRLAEQLDVERPPRLDRLPALTCWPGCTSRPMPPAIPGCSGSTTSWTPIPAASAARSRRPRSWSRCAIAPTRASCPSSA